MIEEAKALLLRILRVPPDPTPPAGAPESLRIFRAAHNYFRLLLIKWGVKQAIVLLGLIVALIIEFSVNLGLANVPVRVLEGLALIVFLVQLPISFLFVRFGYEMRWYIVTDRSLRIRYGLQHVREMTMTFANIQQITIQQGPLQRLLGIADLQVRTAGGGSGGSPAGEGSDHSHGGDSMHIGYFRGVESAELIRDLILERLRRWRDSGLGDPDEARHAERPIRAGVTADASALEAAHSVLAEARLLRQRWASPPRGSATGVQSGQPV